MERSILVGICTVGVACLVILAPVTWGQTWEDVQLASSCCDMAQPDCCDSAGCCSSCCDGCSSDCGYCCRFPMCDELMCRLTPMMKQMADCGVIYAPGLTQFYQGVASGGVAQDFEYGGKVDQFLILDAGKLGLWDGMTMTLHAETRFGDDVNQDAVVFAPVNTAMLYPKSGEHDTAITNLSFAQAISDDVQLTFGKTNFIDFLQLLYPQTGRGVDGFMNASLLLPVSMARVAPLSMMNVGALKMHGKQVQGLIVVYDTKNVATTSGLDDLFDNGANIFGYWRFFTERNGLPGSHGFGGIWSTGEFVAFDPTSFVIIPDEGLVATPQGGAYTLAYIYEQTLWMDCCNPKRNVAVLSQWGIADEATSPIGWSANISLQATGFNDARPHDRFGMGYFHTGISNDLKNLFSGVLPLQDVDGVEIFYSTAIAKGMHLTGDLQVIEPAVAGLDTAVVAGLRLSAGM